MAQGRVRNLFFDIGFDIDNNPLINADRSVDRFKENTNGAAGEMGKLEKGTTSFGDSARRQFGLVRARAAETTKVLADMRYKLAGLAATGAAFIGATTRSAMKFEQQMAMVGSVSQATSQEFKILEESAMRAGRETAHTAQDAAQGMELLARRGLDVNETITVLNPILDAASAEQVDLALATDIATTAMNTMSMDASQMGRVVDVLIQTSQTSGAEFSELGTTFTRVASQARNAGWDIEQLSASIGILADVGIKGSMAGTTLSATLRDLSNAADNGKISVAGTTMSIADSEGNFLSFAEIIGQLDDSLEGLSETARDEGLREIFGDQALKGINEMLEQGVDGLSEYEEQLRNSAGTASRVAAEQLDTLGGAFEKLRGSINVASIIMGSRFSPAIRLAAEVINSMINTFIELPEVVQTGIALFIGLTTAALGLAAGIGFANAGLTALMANPIVLKITGIMLAISYLIVVTQDLWVGLMGGNSLIVDLMQRFTDWMGLSVDVGDYFEWLGDRIISTFKGSWDFIAGFGQWFLALGKFITGIVVAMFTFDTSMLAEGFGEMADGGKRMLNGFIEFLSGILPLMLNPFMYFGNIISDFFSSAISKPIDFVVDKFNWLRDTLANIDIGETISEAFSDSALGKATEKISNFTSGIRDFLPFSPAKEGALKDIDNVGEGFFSTISDSFKDDENILTDTVGSISGNIMGAFGNGVLPGINGLFKNSSQRIGQQGIKEKSETKTYNNVTHNKENKSTQENKVVEVLINEININGSVENEAKLKGKLEKAARSAFKKIIAEERAALVGGA